MTLDDFLALSDRERDALVAEKVMGWTAYFGAEGTPLEKNCYVESREVHKYLSVGHQLWAPTTNIADAWEVVEKLINSGRRSDDWYFTIDSYGNEGINQFTASFEKGPNEKSERHQGHDHCAPLAISIAALRAVGAIED